MPPLALCRERLTRILGLLERHGGSLRVRDFARTFGVWDWELEQAAALGWLEIVVKKPHIGRPSRFVQIVNNRLSAKFPPWRAEIDRPISVRHFRFALKSIECAKKGRSGFMPMPPLVDAYQCVYSNAKNRRAATASASRLMRHPDVCAARRWLYARIRGEIPASESMPENAAEIWSRLPNRRTGVIVSVLSSSRFDLG
jgi:hypothetical protein